VLYRPFPLFRHIELEVLFARILGLPKAVYMLRLTGQKSDKAKTESENESIYHVVNELLSDLILAENDIHVVTYIVE
jgi:hypothetical protein